MPAFIETLRQKYQFERHAIIVVDATDTVCVWNGAAEALYEIAGVTALNHRFSHLDLGDRMAGLREKVQEAKDRQLPILMDDVSLNRRSGRAPNVDVAIVPILESGGVAAVVVFAEEAERARPKEQLARIVEEHAAAIEELQAANQELETTNHALQSTNQDLEDTNKELQGANEELEATVKELQAANSELARLNSEVEERTGDLRRLEQAVVLLDDSGVVTMWNATAARLWGMPADEALARPLWAMLLGDGLHATRDAITRVRATGQAETLPEISLRLPGGETSSATLQISALRDAAGRIVGAVVTAPAAP